MQEKALIESLYHMKNFFEKNNIDYWLDTGTLLGAVRDKKFITWDYDIDFGIWQKDILKIFDHSKELEKFGYEVCYFQIEMCIKIIRKNSEVDLNIYALENESATRVWHIPNCLGSKLDYFYWILTIKNIELKRSKVSKKLTKKLKKLTNLIPTFKKKLLSKITILIYQKIGSKKINVIIPKKYFVDLSKIEFYSQKFNAPKDVESYLEFRYGNNWRTPKKDYVYYRDDESIVR